MAKEVIKSTTEELTPSKTNTPIAKPIPKKPTVQKSPIPLLKPTPTIPKLPPIIAKKPSPISQTSEAPEKRLKPRYGYIGKETLSEILKKSIPKQFIPTSRFAAILGLVFLCTIVLALIQFPFDKLLSGSTEIVIGIGYPWPFLELEIMNPESPPLRPLNLFLDLIIYLIIAYIIDITINFITETELIKSKEERMNQPKVYRRLNPTLADKMTKKVFNKV